MPIGQSLGSFWARAFSLTTSVAWERTARKAPKARLRWKRAWVGETASTPSTGVKKTRIGSLFFASRIRVKVKTTSLAVSGSPLWKTALSTRSKSHVRSFSCFHALASPGMNWPPGST